MSSDAPPTAAERAALDRLAGLLGVWASEGGPSTDLEHDLGIVLGLARRATPLVELTPQVEGGSVVSGPQLQESAPRDHAGGEG